MNNILFYFLSSILLLIYLDIQDHSVFDSGQQIVGIIVFLKNFSGVMGIFVARYYFLLFFFISYEFEDYVLNSHSYQATKNN